MKRFLSGLIAILLLLSLLPGCGEEEPQGPVVYEKPTFTPGTLQSDLLKTEPGNFDRICETGNGDYLEIDSGYYVNWWGHLYYAESTDLDTWYYVCNDPDCSHSYGCSSFLESNTVWYQNGMIYFATNADSETHIQGNMPSMDALLCMQENGENIQLVYACEETANAGYFAQFWAIPGGFLLGGEFLRPDGYFDRIVFLYTLNKGRQVVLEEVIHEEPVSRLTKLAQYALAMNGDYAVVSQMFTDDTDYLNTLCWFQNGEPVFTDISEIPVWGGYLQDNIIRCFHPGDGYYDVDLLTGEWTRLADTQLAESKARILQPNCIIETTLLNPEAAVEKQEMRFFDGQQWHTVSLPEELLVPNETFEVLALSSDRVIFTVRQRHAYDPEKDTMVWYCMKLGGETYTVEPMGTFQKPMGISLADQP